MNPLFLKAAAVAAVAAALLGAGFAGGFKWQASTITQLKLEQANERIASQRASRAEAERRIASQRAADLQAQAATRAVAADRVRTDAAGSGLRLTTDATVRASTEDPAACAVHARALGVVFDNCAARLTEVASDLDLWVIEAVKQNEAAQ